ncbi:MAG: protein kinase, partial [Planctomycetota bacterium]
MQATSNDAKRIFTEAIENFSASQWPDFLHDACAGDGELRARVECLLDAHRLSDPLLDRLAGATRDETENDETENIEESIGTLIGPYKLLQRIGEGGFGVVYMAEQTRPVRRKVALKVIKPGMDRREIVVRFEAEQQALALMDHPNIAKVFDVGETQSGRPYLVMELVRGIPVTEYADINHLSTGQRLSLFALICRAVHHAHQKGVIHRD